MRLLAAFAILVLFGLFAFTCVRDASAAQVGAQDDGDVLVSGPALAKAMARAQAIHATAFRVIVRGNRGIAPYDAGIQALCAAGFRVQVTLTDYATEQFVTDAITRWRQCVVAWSFWNEPELNIGFGWYAHLHRAGYQIARALDPDAKVLIGETSSWASPANLLGLDTLPGDGLAVHPYQFKLPPEDRPAANSGMRTGIGSLPSLAKRLKHPLYVTEFGYHRNHQGWLGRAIRVARLARAREFVFYQLTKETDTVRPWDTLLTSTGAAALAAG